MEVRSGNESDQRGKTIKMKKATLSSMQNADNTSNTKGLWYPHAQAVVSVD
jgi:hypothetical protein